jgi:hypothetical protein
MKTEQSLEQELASCRTMSLSVEEELRVSRRLETVVKLLEGLEKLPPPGRPCLIYQWDKRVELVELPAKGGGFTVGREKTDLLLKAPTVSRTHFRLRLDGDLVRIEDGGSKHGTKVNGERLVGRRCLCDGDLIQAGKQVLAFVFDKGEQDQAQSGAERI